MGKGDETRLVYWNAGTNFSRYDKAWIESVTMWTDKTGDLAKLPKETQQALTGAFYKAIHAELSKDYRIVTKPGPGTIRFRAAITEAKGANVPLNTITSVVPQPRMLSKLAGMAADVAVIVGRVSFEATAHDAMTGELIGAAVDRRVGAKTIAGAFSKWGDVEAAFGAWAKQLGSDLTTLRARRPRS